MEYTKINLKLFKAYNYTLIIILFIAYILIKSYPFVYILGLPATHDLCPYCYKSIHKSTLRRHIKNQHGSSGSAKCNFCDGIFKNESSLKDHQRQKHNVYQSMNIS